MKDLEVFKSKLNIPRAIQGLSKIPQVECPVQHHFADGQYVRETFMPAGTFAIGKKHKFSTINILLKGKISVYHSEDIPIQVIKAPAIWRSGEGVQKMAYFHEDTIWVNTHPTQETDIEVIENIFIDNKELTWHG